jgi:hypothetical protein
MLHCTLGLKFVCLSKQTCIFCLMVFDATFNNISAISWQSVLLEETGGPGENHWPVASHRQTWSHNVVHLALIDIWTHNISGDMHRLHLPYDYNHDGPRTCLYFMSVCACIQYLNNMSTKVVSLYCVPHEINSVLYFIGVFFFKMFIVYKFILKLHMKTTFNSALAETKISSFIWNIHWIEKIRSVWILLSTFCSTLYANVAV